MAHNPDDSQSAADPYGQSPLQKSDFFVYDPCDARVECFGIELAIKNRDITTFKYLWSDQKGKWADKHFAFVLDRCLEEYYDMGIGHLFRSQNAHIIFNALNPEDKDNFICNKIIDKVISHEYWETHYQKKKKIT